VLSFCAPLFLFSFFSLFPLFPATTNPVTTALHDDSNAPSAAPENIGAKEKILRSGERVNYSTRKALKPLPCGISRRKLT
jgi:hypothetical protein